MILTLVPKEHEFLKSPVPKFDFKDPPLSPSVIATDLAETMIHNGGIGLAANQCGLLYRVFVITGAPIRACFNPMIVDYHEEQVALEEGCLSMPGYYVKIKRPKTIRTRFTMPNGETVTRDFTGLTARIFQHELDHLEGIDFKSRANAYHRDIANRKYKIAKRKLKHGPIKV